MGFFAEWVMVRQGPQTRARERFAAAGVRPRGELEGWALGRSQDADAGELASRLASEAGEPALGGWIYDSDFALLVGVGPDGGSFETLLGEPYETDNDPDYTRELEQLASGPGQFASAQALSAWSKLHAPQPISVEQGLTIISEKPVFVEEVLAKLFKELGLPEVETLIGQ